MQTRTKLSSVIISSSWIILCAATLAATHCEASFVWDGDLEAPAEMLRPNYKKQFDKINEFLIKTVHTNSLEMNMKKANEEYNQLLSSNYFYYSFEKNKMIEALELFLSLGDLESKAKCNMESYRILLQNDRSADSVAHKNIRESELDSLNRVQRIIHDVSIRHAESCYNRYPVSFREIYFKMDQEMVDKVSFVLDDYIKGQKAEERQSDIEKIYSRFVFEPEAMGVWNFAKATHDKIPELPVRSQSYSVLPLFKKEGVDTKKLKQIIKNQIQKPCEYYVRHLKGVFIPARYDAVFHKEDNDLEYHMSWARFRLCNGLLVVKRKELAKKVKIIHKESEARKRVEDV